jgi:hypothetical protein
MNLNTRICGLLVGLMWLAVSASAAFYVYSQLSFHEASAPLSVVNQFLDNRLSVVCGSLTGMIFLTGALGTLLGQHWARGYSLFLCALGALYAVGQFLIREAFNLKLEPILVVPLAAASLSIWVWLFSRGGRTYFRQAGQPE